MQSETNERRLGFVGVVLADRAQSPRVNELLSAYGHCIKARIGVPDEQTSAAVIGLVVEGENATIGALTAKLGSIDGVQVKSALVKKKESE